LSPNEPKTPVIRTLPPVDVVFENDGRDELRRPLEVSAADLAVLRRIALGTAPTDSAPPPESRSMRAAKKTVSLGKYSALFLGALTLATEVIRLWKPEHASAIGAIARAVLQLVGTAPGG